MLTGWPPRDAVVQALDRVFRENPLAWRTRSSRVLKFDDLTPSDPEFQASAWSLDEQAKLLDSCLRAGRRREYLHPLVLLGLETGLRLETIVNLEWHQVDLLTDTLRLSASDTRTGRALDIRLGGDAAGVLDDLWTVTRNKGLESGRILDVVGLPTENDLPSLATIRAHFEAARRAAKISPGGFENLSRTFADNCYRDGVPFVTASALVDWGDLSTLTSVYQDRSAPKHRVGKLALRQRRSRGGRWLHTGS